jgi:hypothetical protein
MLVLKPRFDQLWDEWIARTATELTERREWIAAVSHATGIEDPPEIDWDDPNWVTWHTASLKLIDQEEQRSLDRFLDSSFSLADEISCSACGCGSG